MSPHRSRAQQRVVLLTSATAALAGAITIGFVGQPALFPAFELEWWALIPMVYIAEMLVVHLRYRHEAHSFSLSEIPLVLGLFLATPLALVAAVVLGNTLVLTVHRRQPPIKLAFNVAQFSLVASATIVVFRAVVALGDIAGPAGWIAAMVAMVTGNILASSLISRVIAIMGGRNDQQEILRIVALSTLGSMINAALALIAVNLLWHNPNTAWMALVPLAVVLLAYRSQVAQVAERARLKALYEATLDLHNTPQLEPALAAGARHACAMVDAEFCEVVLFPIETSDVGYLTAVGPSGRSEIMRPVRLHLGDEPWSRVGEGRTVILENPEHGPTPFTAPISDGVAAPLTDRTGRVIGMLIAANRLGNVDTFTAEDQELLETLASRLSIALENGRLEDSLEEITKLKDQLEEAARTKDQFIASISHELRTPLTAVVGLSQELTTNRELFNANEIDEFVELIAQQSGELAYIVEDLLVAARADTGTLHLEPEELNLKDIADEVIGAQFADEAQPPEISGVDDLYCLGDPFRVRQVVRNLLTNAVRYGGDRIWVRVEPAGSMASITVADNGPGVPPGSEETVFQAYERAHGPIVEPASVGLGLAVARQLARLMKGDLIYRRRLSVTEFVLVLPISSELPSTPNGLAVGVW